MKETTFLLFYELGKHKLTKSLKFYKIYAGFFVVWLG